jgi:hypothetical protein
MVWKIWACSDCDFEVTDGWLKHDMEDVVVLLDGLFCPKCGSPLSSYMHSSQKHVGIFSEEERVSLAMGVHPDQIPEAMRAFPGSRYRPDGALIYKGRSGKKAAMRQRGYTEYN